MEAEFDLTPKAEQFIRRLLRLSVGEGGGVRLSVSPGGCSGLSPQFSPEAAPQPGDVTVYCRGIRLFVPQESLKLLAGVSIDFIDTPTSTGLVFLDPKASACSACGSGSVAVSAIQRKGCG